MVNVKSTQQQTKQVAQEIYDRVIGSVPETLNLRMSLNNSLLVVESKDKKGTSYIEVDILVCKYAEDDKEATLNIGVYPSIRPMRFSKTKDPKTAANRIIKIIQQLQKWKVA